ncbi:MAG: succinate dehydrogenase, cytochrome b556 subunit [Gammaproteobacteria bacterium]
MRATEQGGRPVFLNLFKIRQPIGAVASIVHRVSGALLVLALAPGLYLLERALSSPAAYAGIANWFDGGIGRVVLLASVWLFAQHLLSGIRAMLLDMDIGAQLRPARAMAWATFAGSVALTALVGFAT